MSLARLRPLGRLVAALVAALALLASASSSAGAHALLEDTTPDRGATVAQQPAVVTFRFDESVEGNLGAVEVYDDQGNRVDQGDAFHPGDQGPVLGVHLKPSLRAGTYTATYRVVSADTHVVSGGNVFSVGHPSPTGLSVSRLLDRNRTGPVTSTAFSLVRSLQYLCLAVGIGGLAFVLLVWLPVLDRLADGSEAWEQASARVARRTVRVVVPVALLGALASALGLVLEGAEATGRSFTAALDGHVLRSVAHTRFGTVWLLAITAWLIVAALGLWNLAPARARGLALRPVSLGATGLALPSVRRVGWVLLALPAAVLIVVPALAGHASVQAPVAVNLPANVVHVLAMTVWVGGIAALLIILPGATRQLEPGDRSRVLAGALARFSPLALGAVMVLMATGWVQAYVEVRSVHALVSTDYGRTVLIKFVLLCALIGLGVAHRRIMLPRLRRLADHGATPGRVGVQLRAVLRGELAVMAAVLIAAGALAGYAPAIAQTSGPVSGTTMIGPIQLQYTVEPAGPGPNQVHLYLENPRDGSPNTQAKQLTVTATQAARHIGPLPEQTENSGPGHYTLPFVVFTGRGTWQLQVTARVSDFDEYTQTITVHVS